MPYIVGAGLLVFSMAFASPGSTAQVNAEPWRPEFAPPSPVQLISGTSPPSRHVISSVGPVQIVSASFAFAVSSRCRVQPWSCAAKLLVTSDLGRHWRDITPPTFSSGIAITDVDFVDPMHGWAMGYSCNAQSRNAIWRTVDGGVTWSSLGVPPVSCADASGHSLDLLTATSGWMASWDRGSAGALVSTAAEASWSRGPRLPVPGDISFISPKVGFLVGFPESPKLYRTTDAGVSWHLLHLGLPSTGTPWRRVMSLPTFFSRERGIEPIDLSQFGGSPPEVVFDTTTDGGRTWSLGTVFHPRAGRLGSSWISRTSISSPTTWWVSIGKPTSVYVTRDAGKNWWVSKRRFPGTGDVYAFGDRRAWLVSGNGDASALYLTTNGGRSWRHLHP